MFRIGLVFGLSFALAACTWVKVDEAGADVQVSSADSVTSCQRVGKVTSVSRAKIAGINRSYQKLAKELETIARNEAVDLGGNTVVPLGEMISGNEQAFQVYSCP